jgi:hypothetical protein
MLTRGLVAGFGGPIAHELPALRGIGVQLIRTDCQKLDAQTIRARVDEIYASGIAPFPIVSDWTQLALLPPGTHVELRNEPDIEGPSASDYGDLVATFARECDKRGLHGWAGSISNLNRRGLEYLAALRPDRWPASLSVSVHRYPNGETPYVPHSGYRSREHEVETLRMIIGARRWGVSEFGYTTANRATSFWDRLLRRRRQWTDAQVAEFVAFEWQFWQDMGAGGAVLYQLDDSLTNNQERFGIRRITDGSWKPVATTFRKVLA